MDNVKDLLSKFKESLDSIIVEYKDKVSDIEKEEDFIQVLSDLILKQVMNYSLDQPKDDCTIICARVFDRI